MDVSKLLAEGSASDVSLVSPVLTGSLASSAGGAGQIESPGDNNWRDNFMPRHVLELQQSEHVALDNSLVGPPRLSQQPKQLPFKFVSAACIEHEQLAEPEHIRKLAPPSAAILSQMANDHANMVHATEHLYSSLREAEAKSELSSLTVGVQCNVNLEMLGTVPAAAAEIRLASSNDDSKSALPLAAGLDFQKMQDIQKRLSRVRHGMDELRSLQHSRASRDTSARESSVPIPSDPHPRHAMPLPSAEGSRARPGEDKSGGRGGHTITEGKAGVVGGEESAIGVGGVRGAAGALGRLTALSKEMASLRETAQAARTILHLRSTIPGEFFDHEPSLGHKLDGRFLNVLQHGLEPLSVPDAEEEPETHRSPQPPVREEERGKPMQAPTIEASQIPQHKLVSQDTEAPSRDDTVQTSDPSLLRQPSSPRAHAQEVQAPAEGDETHQLLVVGGGGGRPLLERPGSRASGVSSKFDPQEMRAYSSLFNEAFEFLFNSPREPQWNEELGQSSGGAGGEAERGEERGEEGGEDGVQVGAESMRWRGLEGSRDGAQETNSDATSNFSSILSSVDMKIEHVDANLHRQQAMQQVQDEVLRADSLASQGHARDWAGRDKLPERGGGMRGEKARVEYRHPSASGVVGVTPAVAYANKLGVNLATGNARVVLQNASTAQPDVEVELEERVWGSVEVGRTGTEQLSHKFISEDSVRPGRGTQGPMPRHKMHALMGFAEHHKSETIQRDRALVMTPDGSVHRKESCPLPRSLNQRVDYSPFALNKTAGGMGTSHLVGAPGEVFCSGGLGSEVFVMEEAGTTLVADGSFKHPVMHRIISATLQPQHEQQVGQGPAATSEETRHQMASKIDWARFYALSTPTTSGVGAGGADICKVTQETIRALEHLRLKLPLKGACQQGPGGGTQQTGVHACAGNESDPHDKAVDSARGAPTPDRPGGQGATDLVAYEAEGETIRLLGSNVSSKDSNDLVAQLLELSRVAGRRADATITASEINHHAAALNSLKPELSVPSPLASAADHHIQKPPHAVAGGGVALAVRGVSGLEPQIIPGTNGDFGGRRGLGAEALGESLSDLAESRALDIVRRNFIVASIDSPPAGSQRSTAASQELGRNFIADSPRECVDENEIQELESRRRALMLSLSLRDKEQAGTEYGRRGNGSSVRWQGGTGDWRQEEYDDEAEEDDSAWSDSDGYDTEDSFFDNHRPVIGKTEVDVHLEEALRAQHSIDAQMARNRRVSDALNNAPRASSMRLELPTPPAHRMGSWKRDVVQGQGHGRKKNGSRVQFDDEMKISDFEAQSRGPAAHVDAVDGFGRVVTYGLDVTQTHSKEGLAGIGNEFRDLAPFGLRDTSHLWHDRTGSAAPEEEFAATKEAWGFALC